MSIQLPVGTRIRFLETLESGPDDHGPGNCYARKGDLGTVAEGQFPCKEGHWVFWDKWPSAPFGAELGKDFEQVEVTGYESVAWWPEDVILLSEGNTSTDTHATYAQADAVCMRLLRDGFGGDRQIFPVKVKTRPICKVIQQSEP